jgi:hypothetical protein
MTYAEPNMSMGYTTMMSLLIAWMVMAMPRLPPFALVIKFVELEIIIAVSASHYHYLQVL